jgi:hypothetical protein
MTRRLVCVSLSIALIQIVSAVSYRALAAEESTSTKRVGGCHIEQAGAYHALSEISEKAHVAIGVQPDNEPTVVLDFPGGTSSRN